MYKKIFVGLLLAFSIILSFSYCFAENENHSMTNSIRNAVGGAENAMNDAAKGIGNTAQNAGNAIKNGAGAIGNTIQGATNNAGNTVKDSMNKTGNSIENGMNNIENKNNANSDNNGDNYTATRTSADNTVMGMNSTVWTWVIIGVAAIGIIALIWYYTSQVNNNNR